MPPAINPMSEDLRRQRRNLLAASCILCFMKFGGIRITKTTILGTEVEFSQSSAIFVGLWLIWLYFGIRYYQYFMEEGVGKIISRVVHVLNDKCNPIIQRIISEKYSGHVQAQGSELHYSNIIKEKVRFNTYLFKGFDWERRDDFGSPTEFELEIKHSRLLRGVISSVFSIFTNYAVMMDYLFPIIFAIFTLAYCNHGNWPGSFLSLSLQKW